MTPEDCQAIIREKGLCGSLSPDGMQVCILDPGHEEAHPWPDVEPTPDPMTQGELRHLVFEALFQKLQGDESVDVPRAFVGLQGDKVVVMQGGGQHFAVLVLPAHAEVPA